MKKGIVLSVFFCLMLIGTLMTQKVDSKAEEDFFTAREYRSKLDSKIIDGKRYYFIFDYLQLLIFDDELNFVRKISHPITSDYKIEMINDIDGNGSRDILFIMLPDYEYNINDSGPCFMTYSFETGDLIWYKYLKLEELFSKQEEIVYPNDYQVIENNLIITYGNIFEKVDVITGESEFKKQFDNNVWSASFVDDVNDDAVLDIIVSKQPNHLYLIDGKNGNELLQKEVGGTIQFDNGSITPNVWQVRYNESTKTIGMVTENGIFYEFDIDLDIQKQYRYQSIPTEVYDDYIHQGYTDLTSGSTYKNAKLDISDDLDGDGNKDFVINYFYDRFRRHSKMAVYYSQIKQMNYEEEFVLRYLGNGNATLDHCALERYCNLNLKTEEVEKTNVNLPEAWTNGDLTLIKNNLYLELYQGDELINKTLIDNQESYKISKYLYLFNEYGAKTDDRCRYNEYPHKTKQFIQYDDLMHERFEYTAEDDEWIVDFNPIDKNENLIFIHTVKDNGTHHIKLIDVIEDVLLKDYMMTDYNFDNTIAIVPVFDLDSTNDSLLVLKDVNDNDGIGSIYRVNLNTSENEKIENITINNYVAGAMNRVDIHHDLENGEIEAFIFISDDVIKVKTYQHSNQVEYNQFKTDLSLGFNIEQIDDIDGDGWGDYLILESRIALYNDTALFLTGSENPLIEMNEDVLFYQSKVDFNEDGVNDFIGADLIDNTFNIYTYNQGENKLEMYWTYEINNTIRYQGFIYKPIIAIDKDHIMYYDITKNGHVKLIKVNINTHKKTATTIFTNYLYNGQHELGTMISSIDNYTLFEYNELVYVVKDDKLVSVIKGDLLENYHDNILIEDKDLNSLYISKLDNLANNVTYKTLYYDDFKIDLQDEDFVVARLRYNQYWKQHETTEKEFSYLVDKDRVIIVETYNDKGEMKLHVYVVKKKTYLRVLIFSSIVIVTTSVIVIIKKKQRKEEE